jgi:hypothetical protein
MHSETVKFGTIHIHTGPIFDRWRWVVSLTSGRHWTQENIRCGTNMFVLFHVPFSPVHIQSSCRIRTAINSCMVCMCTCIFMSWYVVTCKPSIPVILWRYVQVEVSIAYMNGVEFFTKLSWIHYPKSIYQTRNFAMRGGETSYYRDQSTNWDIFTLSDRISFFVQLS